MEPEGCPYADRSIGRLSLRSGVGAGEGPRSGQTDRLDAGREPLYAAVARRRKGPRHFGRHRISRTDSLRVYRTPADGLPRCRMILLSLPLS